MSFPALPPTVWWMNVNFHFAVECASVSVEPGELRRAQRPVVGQAGLDWFSRWQVGVYVITLRTTNSASPQVNA